MEKPAVMSEHTQAPRPARLAFLKSDAAGGVILVGCAAIALVIANSGLAPLYKTVLHTALPVTLGPVDIHLDVEEWIKDGLMAIFFFVVGLELKRELVAGALSDPRGVVLPVAAALGGMALPAVIYLLLAGGADARGWPVPVATDIAFAIAALAILGRRAPGSLRIFLLTLAVMDDLGAVVLIALLYSSDLEHIHFLGVGLGLAAMLALSLWRRAPLWLYGLGAALVWLFALKSGIHTSVAGVAAALTVPLGREAGQGPLKRLERALHPVSVFVVMPLFALAVAGVPLTGLTLRDLAAPVPLGIALALALGKPAGVLAASYGVAWSGLATLPRGAGFAHMLGIACLCGIGFTMSLYLGGLAFAGDYNAELRARLGVLLGSALALILGGAALASTRRR
jgi:Na+:H+ antiporter, NhaA family